MSKFTLVLSSGAFLIGTLVGLPATSASAVSTITTCTDLTAQKIIVQKESLKSCRPSLAKAIWHIEQSDSSSHTGVGYANLRTCTSKRAQFDYELIKSKCAKYQVTNDYWRSAALPAKPVITQATPSSHESVFLTLASESATNTDAPIDYYTITSSKGEMKKVYSWRALIFNFSGLLSSTAYTFTITATSVDGTSPASDSSPSVLTHAYTFISDSSPSVLTQHYVAPVVAVPVVSCANGGLCVLGDRGPGGGLIYYAENVTGFNCGQTYSSTGSPTGGLCHYLEVAPDGWNTGSDPAKIWAVVVWQSTDVTEIANEETAFYNALGIGLGYKNSVAIVTQNGVTYNASTNDYSAGAARAYNGGAKSDWYLPTTAELNLMCQWSRGVTQDVTTACVGGSMNSTIYGASGAGLVEDYYWSSSERSALVAWWQDFELGFQNNNGKYNTNYVRPVRAF